MTRAQVVLLIIILLVGAVSAYYFVQNGLPKSNSHLTPSAQATPTFSPSPTSSVLPTPTPAATPSPVNAGSLTVVSVNILQPYNPGGPTVEVTLKNNATTPVTSLQAVLSLSGRNYTYDFSGISSSNPLLPNQYASQTQTLLNAGFNSNQTYPLEITGTLQNGTSINYTAPVTITQSSQPVAYGGNGTLELTMTLEKTSFILGEPVNLTLTVTNISDQTISYVHTGLDFDFQVYNDTNNLVYQWSNFMGIAQFVTLEPLQAGASMSENFTWQQTCNFNLQVNGDPISPGTYNIVGETGPTYGIQTTPIQLTIA